MRRILALFVASSIFYYLDSFLILIGLPNPHWGIFYMPHDFHRLLFAVPVFYSAYVFGVRGAVAATLLSALVFLPRALYLSSYPDGMTRPLAFCLAIGAVAVLLAGLLNSESSHRATQNLLQVVLRGTPIPAFAIDGEHRILYWNRALEELSGVKQQDIAGTDEHWRPFYREKRACMADLLVDGLEEEIPQWYAGKWQASGLVPGAFEVTDFFPHLGRNGRWLRFEATKIVNEAGHVLGAVEILEDVTVRKEAEQALQASRDELRRLAQRVEEVREEERTGLARELHDTAGQAITAVKLDVCHIKKRLEQGQAPTPEELIALNDLLDQTADDVRRISSELRPGVLDDFGLDGAIEWQIDELKKRTDLGFAVSLPSEESQLDYVRRTAIFRVFQELLTNVVRHADARLVHVTLERADNACTLTVADDGCGVDPEKLEDSSAIGIIGMRERLRPYGGELHYDSVPGRGTTARVVMPTE